MRENKRGEECIRKFSREEGISGEGSRREGRGGHLHQSLGDDLICRNLPHS